MKRFPNVLVTLAALGMCFPQVAWAADPIAPAPTVTDVTLADGGVLNGKVVDTQGTGVGGVSVVVKLQDQSVAAATTASDGTFTIQGLSGGVYQIDAADGHGVYRLWSTGTAPPAAIPSATIYLPTDNAGQTRWAPKMLLTNPVFIAAVVATAIAVPVALSNSNSNPKSS